MEPYPSQTAVFQGSDEHGLLNLVLVQPEVTPPQDVHPLLHTQGMCPLISLMHHFAKKITDTIKIMLSLLYFCHY